MKKTTLELVALDLETTGLDARKDEIIEVGMVRFRVSLYSADVEILGKQQIMVKPRQDVSFIIQKITGISNAMLEDAPRWEEVRAQVEAFIGTSPLVGHNVDFDIDFLSSHDIAAGQFRHFDTYILASMLLRDAPAYNLGRLCEFTGIGYTDQHRALPDAEATMRLFGILLGKIGDLSKDSLAAVQGLVRDRDWSYSELFVPTASKSASKKVKPLKISSLLSDRMDPEGFDAAALVPDESEKVPEFRSDIEAIFAAGGPFARRVKGYEQRPGQVDMALAISQAFAREDVFAVEAGTGVGKSFGYLVPSALLSVARQVPIIVATYTLHLQDQLFDKDLPLLSEVLADRMDLRFALLKGRDHYLCLSRLQHFVERPHLTEEDITFAVKLLLWLPVAVHGEKQELALIRNEYRLWFQVCSVPKLCGGAHCKLDGQYDFYARAWQKARRSHIVVTNQAFLVRSRELISDDFPYVVIDEAHHLEETITDQSTLQMDEIEFKDFLNHIGRKEKGDWQGLLGSLRTLGDTVAPVEQLDEIFSAIHQGLRASKFLFASLKQLLLLDSGTADLPGLAPDPEKQGDTEVGQYARSLHLTPGVREQGAWYEAERQSEVLKTSLEKITSAFEKILRVAKKAAKDEHFTDRQTYMLGDVENTLVQTVMYRTILEQSVFHPDDETSVCYLSLNPRFTSVELKVSPLLVGPVLSEILTQKKSVVMTSATLTSGWNFDFFLGRLGISDLADSTMVESPFHYPEQMELYVPLRAPLQKDRGYHTWLISEIVSLVQAFNGHTLVLFTSYSQLKAVHRDLFQLLEEGGIHVLSQGVIGSRGKVIHAFKQDPKSVILGTNSFWEGVDFPGDELRCVIIVKLPFDVPSDPIFAARSATYEDQFMEYALPRAILRFRQGFGRLIRTSTDTGVVALLDGRITGKGYGREFLDSLPAGINTISTLSGSKHVR